MVDVTKSNFLTSLHDFLTYLPTASFIAVDEEMTGIRIHQCGRPNKAELPSERYRSNWKSVPERYGILQAGVALFVRNPDYDDVNGDDKSNDDDDAFYFRIIVLSDIMPQRNTRE